MIITIVGREADPVVCPENSDASIVKQNLATSFGPGMLKRDGIMVLTRKLRGNYEYHLTPPGKFVRITFPFRYLAVTLPVLSNLLYLSCGFSSFWSLPFPVTSTPIVDAAASASQPLLERFVEAVHDELRPVRLVINALCAAIPVSTSSKRARHEETFKEELIARYQCNHPTNERVIKCMLLGHFFSRNEVTASHLVGLFNKQVCRIFGISNVWDSRNGILLFK